MDIDKIVKEYGFGSSSSGGGCMWYTKETLFEGKPAFIAITDDEGCDLPVSLEDPVMVGVYDLNEGDLIQDVEKFPSLKSYLETIKNQP